MITDLYGCTNYSSQLWADNRRSSDGKRKSRDELLATERLEVTTEEALALTEENGQEASSSVAEVEAASGARVVVHQDFEDAATVPVDVTGTAAQNVRALGLLGKRLAAVREGRAAAAAARAPFQESLQELVRLQRHQQMQQTFATPIPAVTSAGGC